MDYRVKLLIILYPVLSLIYYIMPYLYIIIPKKNFDLLGITFYLWGTFIVILGTIKALRHGYFERFYSFHKRFMVIQCVHASVALLGVFFNGALLLGFIFPFLGFFILYKREFIAVKNIKGKLFLSRSIENSIYDRASSMNKLVTYHGMLSSFAMPTLDQNASVRSPDKHIFQSAIHPTTGFPVINEGFDIVGNPIGMAIHESAHTLFQPNINPASGMPMMNDNLDIHGSPYGVGGMNDYHSGISSGHNDYYAHSSSSIDHYNQH